MVKNAYLLIKKLLESGPKTSGELREACEKSGVSASTFYYQLKQLVKLKEIEKIVVEDAKGFRVEKYVLAQEKPVFWEKASGIKGFSVGGIEVEVPASRRILELAAWIRHQPKGWKMDNLDVKKAKLYLQHSGYLVPEIISAPEGPDVYAFEWQDEKLKSLDLRDLMRLELYKFSLSRFFNLKSVVDAVVADSGEKFLAGEPVFVGVCSAPMVVDYVGVYGMGMHPLTYVGRPIAYEPIRELGSACVAVRGKSKGRIRVEGVETRMSKPEKAWVKGLAKHFGAKKSRVVESEFLREDVKREILLKLRDVLDQHALLIPSRYVSLISELWDYSYKNPPSSYVFALATAVDLCLKWYKLSAV